MKQMINWLLAIAALAVAVQSRKVLEFNLESITQVGPSSIPSYFTALQLEDQRRNLQELLQLNVSQYTATQYFTSLYLGTPPQQFKFLIDTGTSCLWIPSTVHNESQYFNGMFDQNASSSFLDLNMSTILEHAPQGTLYGNVVQDLLSLDPEGIQSLANFSFMLVNSTTLPSFNETLIQIDGLLGLAQSAVNSTLDRFIHRLHHSNLISMNGFSLLQVKQARRSKLWLGDYAVSLNENDNDIMWLDSKFANFSNAWATTLNDIELDDTPYTQTYYAMFDSGSRLSYMPSAIFEGFLAQIQSTHNCSIFVNQYVCGCTGENDTSFPAITFTLSSSYSLNMNYLRTFIKKNQCYIDIQSVKSIMPSMDETWWILGENFLSRFYQIYDIDGQRVGLQNSTFLLQGNYTFKYSTDTVVYNNQSNNISPSTATLEQPPQDSDQSKHIVIIVFSLLAVVLVIIGIIIVYIKCKGKFKNKDKDNNRQQQYQVPAQNLDEIQTGAARQHQQDPPDNIYLRQYKEALGGDVNQIDIKLDSPREGENKESALDKFYNQQKEYQPYYMQKLGGKNVNPDNNEEEEEI